MKQNMKRLTALCLAVVLLLALTACGGNGGTSAEDRAKILVQGNMDELYHDAAGEEYLELVGSDPEESHQDYLNGLASEAEFFAYYFGIYNLTDELKEEIVDLYGQIYAKAKYTVGDASKLDDSTYAVKITVSPLNIFDLVMSEEGAMEAFFEKYDGVDVDAMTDEEYDAYDLEWARMILDLCWEKLPDTGYMEDKTMALQITKGSDDYWGIDDDDFYDMDGMIIYYP